MSQKPEHGKKIVSKGKYVQAAGLKFSFNGMGLSFILLAIICATRVAWRIGEMVNQYCCNITVHSSKENERDIAMFSVLTLIISYLARKSIYIAKNVPPVVPLTRANTGDLPALDSLVRASEEPVQEQQAALLRAASEGSQTPVEQLVRAVEGQE